ncbi:DUF3343 domain-containing protein [Tissierella sp. MB52-C2]|uniref:DUF3343 domain-containing protein n=1 Tax=Tissierella sp. MB52-C2 TaxID=3070999 RepID=UPI00280B42B4|nr:DUF3343 domain-containing protein [Tissierella sp. MB52-C2]WMM25619.1 DUF3343 domain-containing protein [Tissierella sp. MB52-C2]
MEDFYCVVTFHVTQHALIFENFMKESNIDVKLMPVPRQVSSSCGTAAKIPCELERDIKLLCTKRDIPIDDFHHIINQKGKSWFSKYINR